jgi:AcrR family transcriptional regulator
VYDTVQRKAVKGLSKEELMAKRAEALSQEREPLSRDRVLRTAMEIADGEGIDALSMRRLASELGVEAMSLYYYVKNKEEILNGIVELALGEMEPPVPGRDPKAAIRAAAVSYHDALRRHPWAHGIITGAIKGLAGSAAERVSPTQMRHMEAELECLRLAGFSPRMTHHAYHLLDSHVVGSTLWEAGIAAAIPKGSLPDLAKTVIARLPPDQFHYTLEHIDQHMGKLKGETSPFEFGLDLILEGLWEMRDEVPKKKKAKRRA